MKKTIVCLTLFTSFTALANPFNPSKLLQESEEFISGLDTKRAEVLAKIEIEKKNALERAEMISSKSASAGHPKLQAVYQACGQELRDHAGVVAEAMSKGIEEKDKTRRASFEKLKASIEKYVVANQCSTCDEEEKLEKLKKYRKEANINYSYIFDDYWFKDSDFQYHATHYVTGTIFTPSSRAIRCDFSGLFRVEDSKGKVSTYIIKDLSNSYDAKLSPDEVLNMDQRLQETLEYIAANNPRLVRSTSQYFRADSSFNKRSNEVKIRINYDKSHSFFRAYEYQEPQVKNPIMIINRDL